MQRRVLLAVLVVLAGCQGGTAIPETATVTPVSVPETPERVAPGVTEVGVVDADRLLAAHRAAAGSRAYRRTTRTVLVYPDGDRRVRRNATRLYDPAAGRALAVVHDRDGQPGRPAAVVRRWTNGTVTVSRTRYVDALTEYGVRPADGFLANHGGGVAVRMLASQPSVTVSRRTTNGGVAYVLTAAPTDAGPGRNGRLRAVITPAGLLRSVTFESTRVVEGRRVTYRAVLRYEPLRSRVGRPAWVKRALATASNGTRTAA